MSPPLTEPATSLALSLALGLLLGVERERRHAGRPDGTQAGLRTFALVALLGGVLRLLDATVAFPVGLALVGVAAFAPMLRGRGKGHGATTEVALVLCYALGGLAGEAPALATAVTIATAAVLHLRDRLHHFVRNLLTDQELHDALIFLVFALVLLPWAPDTPLAPGLPSTQRLLRLVVVLLGISGLGSIASRVLGPKWGLLASGFASGFVSSSATIAALGRRVRSRPQELGPAVAAGLASSIATVLEYVLLVAAVEPALLGALAAPLGAAALGALVVTAAVAIRAPAGDAEQPTPGRPFSLAAAFGFAGMIALVSVVASGLERWIGAGGILIASAIGAIVDAHSTTGAVAAMHHAGTVDDRTASLAVVLALTTNTGTKITLAAAAGGPRFAARIAAGTGVIAACACIGWWLAESAA